METKELEFPCEYPIRVICENVPHASKVVGEAVVAHAADFDVASIDVQPSKNGTFISLRISFMATSRSQLDAMHQDIVATGVVKMVL